MSRGKIARHLKGTHPSVAGQDPTHDVPSSLGNSSNAPASPGSSGYNFLTAIVIDVFSNPEDLFNRPALDNSGDPLLDDAGQQLYNSDGLKRSRKIENSDIWTDYLPMNSILCNIIDDRKQMTSTKHLLCYPFFPPHISLPVKPGEYVWIIKEDKGGEPLYYWMCRKVGIRQVDDLNITHMERQDSIIDRVKNFNETGNPVQNPGGLSQLANFYRSDQGSSMPGISDFDTLHLESIAYKEEFTAEPVPRQSKNCADLLLQGSNNSHIMLGTEKFVLTEEDPEDPRIAGAYTTEMFTGESSVSEAIDLRKPLSPAIDLCIGRKLADMSSMISDPPIKEDVMSEGSDLTDFGVIVGRREIGNQDIETYEVDKTRAVQGKDPLYGEFIDYDPTNCLARIYMTNSPKVDEIFGFPSLGTTLTDDNEADLESENYPAELSEIYNYGTATIYGQNIRMRSDATMKIYNSIGQSMITMTPEGDIVIQANTETGGKIVLEAEGDIRIVPGATGIVKIGDDLKAESLGLTGLVPVAAQAIPGAPIDLPGAPKVNTVPVVSSGGGVIVGAGSGKLASKVVIF